MVFDVLLSSCVPISVTWPRWESVAGRRNTYGNYRSEHGTYRPRLGGGDRKWGDGRRRGRAGERLRTSHARGPEPIRGPDGFKQYKRTLREAFPDISVVVEDRVVGEDAVVDRYRMSGTHEGEFNGIAPTGTEVEFTGIIVHYVEDGKVAENVVEFDRFDIMQQLGVVEPPEE